MLTHGRILKMTPHAIFFFFGFFYYLAVPPIIGYLNAFAQDPLMHSWHDMFSEFQRKFGIANYSFFALLFLVSFFLGEFLAKRVSFSRNRNRFSRKTYVIASCAVVATGLFSMLVLFALRGNPSVSAYNQYDVGVFGATLTLHAIVLFFATTAAHIGKPRLAFLAVAVIVGLSLYLFISGVRIGLVNAFFALVCYRLLKGKGYPVFGIAFCGIASILLAIARVGESLSPEKMLLYFFAEPNFTWFSAGTMFSGLGDELLWLQAPLSFIGSIINFVPTFAFPRKAEYIVPLLDLVYFEAPLGATNALVTSIGNFGVLLFWIYPMIIGFMLRMAYRLSKTSIAAFSYYVCMSSTVPFQLFRDGSAIYMKQVFWNFLVLPGLFLLLAFLVKQLISARS